MRIRVSDPNLCSDLLRFLRKRPDVIAEELAPGEVGVSILGSRRLPENELELELRLRAWRAAHPDVAVDVVPG